MRTLLILITLIFLCLEAKSQDTITVVSYNILNFPNPSNTDPLGEDAARVIYFREIIEAANADLILVQELKTDAGATMLLDELNNNSTTGKVFAKAPNFYSYGPAAYQLGNMLFYNSGKFNFISQLEVPDNNTVTGPNGNTVWAPRQASYYEMEAYTNSCLTWTIPLHLFSSHLKGGFDEANNFEIADRDRRVLGAQDLMDYLNTSLTMNDNIIAVGDLNLYSHLANNTNNPTYDEPAYEVMMDATINSNPLVDQLGAWERNTWMPTDLCQYTQSTRAGGFDEFGNDGAPGGLDDRFDFVLMNQAIDAVTDGISYVANSNITLGTPKMWNAAATASSSPIATQIHQMSDHYPVIAQFVMDIPNDILMINSNPIPTDIYRVFDQITSTGLVPSGNDVTFKATNEITLDIGFCVEAEADFSAEIEDACAVGR